MATGQEEKSCQLRDVASLESISCPVFADPEARCFRLGLRRSAADGLRPVANLDLAAACCCVAEGLVSGFATVWTLFVICSASFVEVGLVHAVSACYFGQ